MYFWKVQYSFSLINGTTCSQQGILQGILHSTEKPHVRHTSLSALNEMSWINDSKPVASDLLKTISSHKTLIITKYLRPNTNWMSWAGIEKHFKVQKNIFICERSWSVIPSDALFIQISETDSCTNIRKIQLDQSQINAAYT